MGISSSLNAGVQGLAANATKLATISENIANSETNGYKRVDTEFNSLVLDFGAGAFTAGGVRATTTRFIDAEGPLQGTSNPTDITVAGPGFLPTTDLNGLNSPAGSRDLFLVTTGSFRPDQEGFLRTSTGQFLLGLPIDADGNVAPSPNDSIAGFEPINVLQNQATSSPTTEFNLGVNLPATVTDTTVSFDAPVEYFDNLGIPQVLTFSFSPNAAANTWDVELFDTASATPTVSSGAFTLSFNNTTAEPGTLDTVTAGAGVTVDAATDAITINLPHSPVTINTRSPSGQSLLSQIAADFSPIGITKNGVAVGDLQTVEISEEGFIEAVYDTGFRQQLYQVRVADVPNKNGLRSTNGQAYQISQQSGGVFFYDSGTGPVGTTVGFSLEGSTTDVAAELTALIETQRAYSSNARIITTVDEVLEETTNLVR
ncbi:MAG: flagellar hook-basal body complex protein [Pseudomonadota bacterium]